MSTTTTATDLELVSRLRLAVMRLARRLRQQAEPGASPSMLSALASVEALQPLTLRDLAAAERVQPPTMTKIVARLEEAGLLTRASDPHDRRVARIALSAEGTRFIARNRNRKNAYLARRLRSLSPDDVAALEASVDVLERMLEEPD